MPCASQARRLAAIAALWGYGSVVPLPRRSGRRVRELEFSESIEWYTRRVSAGVCGRREGVRVRVWAGPGPDLAVRGASVAPPVRASTDDTT